MKLIPEWKRAWRYFSVHALAISGAIPGAWMSLPDSWKHAVPMWAMATGAGVAAAIGIVGRIVRQAPAP